MISNFRNTLFQKFDFDIKDWLRDFKRAMIKRILFSLFLSHLTHAYESYKPKLNENCVDDIIGKICNEQCVGILVQCTIGCESDSVCISNCAREEAKCIDSCPCHTECYDGCDGCDHYLCNQVCSFLDMSHQYG